MALITVEEAAGHLRLDLETGGSPPEYIDERLPELEAKIAEAESTILDYIEMEEAALSATGVSDLWLPVVQAAVKLYLGYLWDGGDDPLAEGGPIPRLLRRIRYPAIA